MDIKELQLKLREFSKERDWDQFHSIKNLAMALSVESAELLEKYQWLSEEQSNRIHLDAIKKEAVADEVADIFLYLLRIADKSEINLELAIENKMQKNAQKYPIELSKGNAKKYNEF